MKTTTIQNMIQHAIARKASRADSAEERSYRNQQRVTLVDSAVTSAEQEAQHALADAVLQLCSACELDPAAGAPSAPSPAMLRSYVTRALNSAERARCARRRAERVRGVPK